MRCQGPSLLLPARSVQTSTTPPTFRGDTEPDTLYTLARESLMLVLDTADLVAHAYRTRGCSSPWLCRRRGSAGGRWCSWWESSLSLSVVAPGLPDATVCQAGRPAGSACDEQHAGSQDRRPALQRDLGARRHDGLEVGGARRCRCRRQREGVRATGAEAALDSAGGGGSVAESPAAGRQRRHVGRAAAGLLRPGGAVGGDARQPSVAAAGYEPARGAALDQRQRAHGAAGR